MASKSLQQGASKARPPKAASVKAPRPASPSRGMMAAFASAQAAALAPIVAMFERLLLQAAPAASPAATPPAASPAAPTTEAAPPATVTPPPVAPVAPGPLTVAAAAQAATSPTSPPAATPAASGTVSPVTAATVAAMGGQHLPAARNGRTTQRAIASERTRAECWVDPASGDVCLTFPDLPRETWQRVNLLAVGAIAHQAGQSAYSSNGKALRYIPRHGGYGARLARFYVKSSSPAVRAVAPLYRALADSYNAGGVEQLKRDLNAALGR